MTEIDRRWFVTKTGEGYTVEDVGAHLLEINANGDLIFYNEEGIISFSYPKGSWTFVEFQE